jgi:DsbC/DsbD-like thiol-disulfide interchange protein
MDLAWWLAAGMVMAGAVAPASDEHHARPRLIAQTTSVAPGGVVNLGISFEIDPGWHLYWNGRSDSGLPVSIKLELPEGLAADPVQWPAPARHVMPGGILDHIYERRVTLIIPVRVSESVALGPASITAKLEWLECEDVCLAGDAEVSISLAVAKDEPAPSPDAALFAEASARMPVPWLGASPGIDLRWDDGALTVTAADAEYLAFYPAREGVRLTDPIKDGEATTGSLSIRFDWPAERLAAPAEAAARVQGVLEVRRPGVAPAFYALDFAKGQTKPQTPQRG